MPGVRIYTDLSAQLLADALLVNSTVQRLILDSNFKGDVKAVAISKALTGHRSVVTLSYACNHVGPDGAEAFAEMLKKNDVLTELNLNDNEIGESGARKLLAALHVNNRCCKVFLAHNDLTAAVVQKIDAAAALNGQPSPMKRILPRIVCNDRTLNSLLLRGEPSDPSSPKAITDIKAYYTNLSAMILADALRTNTVVRTLDLSNNYVGADGARGLAEMLKSNQWITKLDLSGNPVTDEGARALLDSLANNDSVVELLLVDAGVSSRMVTAVERACILNKQPTKVKHLLAELHRDSPEVTEITLTELADNVVSDLDKYKLPRLVDTAIGLLAQALQGNTTVTKLNFSFQQITDVGARHLAELLRVNRALRSINLAHNLITNEGVKALLSALRLNDTIKAIDIGGANDITPEWFAELAHAVELNNHPLSLKHYLSRILSNDPSLRNVSFRMASTEGPLTDSACVHLAAALAHNTHITELDVSRNQIGNKGAEVLGEQIRKNKAITSLDMSYNEIGIDGAEALAFTFKGNTTVRSLDLSNNRLLDEGGRAIEQMMYENPSITTVKVDGNHISATIQRAIANAALLNGQPQECKRLLLDALANKIVPQIDFSNLETIAVGSITAPRLLDDNSVDCIVYCLVNNPFIERLDLSNNAITSTGCKALAELLHKNNGIRVVRLANNKVSDDGVSALIDVLRLNHQLTELNLENNTLTPFMTERLRMALVLNSQPRLVKTVAMRLRSGDRSLRGLYFQSFDGERYCNDASCEVLAYYMRENKQHCIDHIDLSNNMITDQGANFLAHILQEHTNVKSLKVEGNLLTSRGIRTLYDALPGDSCLTSLSFAGNDCTDPILEEQFEQKLRENAKRLRTTSQSAFKRKGPKDVVVLENTTDYMRRMDDLILAEALADRGRTIRSR
eukprot:TRINITY_DN4432_c0_g1_i2.p1 TRINITY_DN4432_c0_g1~~TRINITY_DN4432_c0_g1_i2.p1  ORF type:complete len:912 (+),score=193.61 TRINITY_DN4432_c0_g1_i2:568-3303(+)